ncbi:pimeloyl-ACP methyl ester carboxylesterase [Streptosporangium album]|uniref:Pimeloyl-ACP methyl ester carboxylesterase n=1 Tax=Streptosporangium album TaxID=47479 RepID=A0A7W7RPL7_9ACTN|nr:alpha/beta fold hydrolase [Streptosporangium album]MBB4935854.1 pimeloyl-ACP methyl ester carboxylesterase [Streptosporangium album]
MLRRFYLIMLAAAVLSVSLTLPALADPDPGPQPTSRDRHTVSVGVPGQKKTTRERAARSAQAAKDRSAAPRAAFAGAVDPVGTTAADAVELAVAMESDGSVTGARYLTTPPAPGTNGVATGLAGVSGASALLTTGDAMLAPEPNDFQSSGRNSGGGKVRGDSAYDVTVLEVDVNAPAWATCLTFEVKYFSEEFPEFVRSAYNDGFVAELDRTTWTTAGSTILAPDNFAYDPSGNVISTNTTGQLAMSASAAVGSTYDGATPLLRAGTPVEPGAHKVFLSIFDQHDAVYDSAVLLRQMHFTQDEAGKCGAGAKPVTKPVIFVPGILGSRLVDESGEEWWPKTGTLLTSRKDEHLDNIMLNDDGQTDAKSNGVYASEVIDKIALLPIYSGAIKLIEDAGYVRGDIEAPHAGENFFLSPVDWRKSAAHNAAELLRRIDRVRQATGADRVNLIAHSQGGLVTQALVRDPDSVGKVNRIASLGTPYLGAAKAIGVMHFKNPCVIDLLGKCLLNRDEAAKITRNFPGFLELLPSDAYHGVVGSPVNKIPGGPLSPGEVRDLMRDKNLTLIDRARAWHQAVDKWDPVDPHVGLTRLVGDGVTTPVSLDSFSEMACDEKHGWWRSCKPQDASRVNWSDHGDGTVPLGSAQLTAELRGNAVTLAPYDKVNHTGLPNKSQVMSAAIYSIQGEGPTQGTLGLLDQEAPVPMVDANGLTGTELVVRGPVNVLLTDASGRRTGFTDPATETEVEDIPGSSYAAGAGTIKHISALLTAGKASAVINSTDFGYVYIQVRNWVNGAVTSTYAYEPILIDPNNRIAFASPGITVPATKVGVVPCDSCPTQQPLSTVTGAAAGDELPPNATATVTYDEYQGRKRVHITASAGDTGGAGVERIEWAIQPSDDAERPAYATYGQPFYYLKPEGSSSTWTLYVRAIDKAGNIESSYTQIPLNL